MDFQLDPSCPQQGPTTLSTEPQTELTQTFEFTEHELDYLERILIQQFSTEELILKLIEDGEAESIGFMYALDDYKEEAQALNTSTWCVYCFAVPFHHQNPGVRVPTLAPRLQRLKDESPCLNHQSSYHMAWSYGPTGPYMKMEKNYAKNVDHFLATERSLVFRPALR